MNREYKHLHKIENYHTMNYTPKITKMLQLLMALHLPVNHSCSIPTPLPQLLTQSCPLSCCTVSHGTVLTALDLRSSTNSCLVTYNMIQWLKTQSTPHPWVYVMKWLAERWPEKEKRKMTFLCKLTLWNANYTINEWLDMKVTMLKSLMAKW